MNLPYLNDWIEIFSGAILPDYLSTLYMHIEVLTIFKKADYTMHCMISLSIHPIGTLNLFLTIFTHLSKVCTNTHIRTQNCILKGLSSAELNKTFPLQESTTYFPVLLDEKSGLLTSGRDPWSLFLSSQIFLRFFILPSSGGILPVNPFDPRFLQQHKLIKSEKQKELNTKVNHAK